MQLSINVVPARLPRVVVTAAAVAAAAVLVAAGPAEAAAPTEGGRETLAAPGTALPGPTLLRRAAVSGIAGAVLGAQPRLDAPTGSAAVRAVGGAAPRLTAAESDLPRRAAAALAGIGVESGKVADGADLVRAKDRLGLNVGRHIDRDDVAAIIAAAGDRAAEERTMFATVGDLRLSAPGARLVGFHEAGSTAARPLVPAGGAPMVTLPSRGRATHPRSAADVAFDDGRDVPAPVTGTVTAVADYMLYGRYPDTLVTIRPDAAPEREVRVLHVRGPQVVAGQRVEAGRSVLADSARLFPFAAQIEALVGRLPHAHVEVR